MIRKIGCTAVYTANPRQNKFNCIRCRILAYTIFVRAGPVERITICSIKPLAAADHVGATRRFFYVKIFSKAFLVGSTPWLLPPKSLPCVKGGADQAKRCRRRDCKIFDLQIIQNDSIDNPPPAAREPPLHKGAFKKLHTARQLPLLGSMHFLRIFYIQIY